VHPGPWRYWQALPPSGRLGIFMHAWYIESMRARIHGRIEDDRLEAHLQAIREHEQMLSDEGVVLLKFWIHLSKTEQKKRLKALERDPRTSWRVSRDDWQAYRAYRKSYALWETLLRETAHVRDAHLRLRQAPGYRDGVVAAGLVPARPAVELELRVQFPLGLQDLPDFLLIDLSEVVRNLPF
jgi:hypothetical protein